MSLAEKIEETYAPSALRDELIREAKKIEEQRDTFLAILTLQQTVKELETRIDDLAPEGDLEQRVRETLLFLVASADFTPAAGFDEGWVSGIKEAVEKVAFHVLGLDGIAGLLATVR